LKKPQKPLEVGSFIGGKFGVPDTYVSTGMIAIADKNGALKRKRR